MSVDGINDISLDYHGDDGELDSRTTKPLVTKTSVKSSATDTSKQYIIGMNNGMLTSGSINIVVNGTKAPTTNNHQSSVYDRMRGNDSIGIEHDIHTTNLHHINSDNNHHHSKEEVESKFDLGSCPLSDQNNGVDGDGHEANGNNAVFIMDK